MATKPYKPQESEPQQVNEPVAAYQQQVSNTNLYEPTEFERKIILNSENDYREGRIYTQEEVDKMVKEWLS